MLSLLYSCEAIERAKRRGRAYMCLMCETLTGEKRISELGPMEDHILKNHVSRDRVPFFCRLCTFKCQTRYQLEHHVKVYPRHKAAADQMGVTKDREQEWMVESPAPYKIGDADMKKFTQEESILFFLGKQAGELVSNVRPHQMSVPTPNSMTAPSTSHPMQTMSQLVSPMAGGHQQHTFAGNNPMAMWGSVQLQPVSPALDQILNGLGNWSEDPVQNFSDQLLGTIQPLVSPPMFGSSMQTLPHQPSPGVGGSLFRPLQPIGASQGVPNFVLPPSQPIPVASQGNNAIGQSAIQAGQGTSNLPLSIPMQSAPAASQETELPVRVSCKPVKERQPPRSPYPLHLHRRLLQSPLGMVQSIKPPYNKDNPTPG